MHNFNRISRLPQYVFNVTSELKMEYRRAGHDIIDLSMGNPDGPTPKHIVEKLNEVSYDSTLTDILHQKVFRDLESNM